MPNDPCPHCSHPLTAHLGRPFVISSQGCALCPCLQPGPALPSARDFVWPKKVAS